MAKSKQTIEIEEKFIEHLDTTNSKNLICAEVCINDVGVYGCYSKFVDILRYNRIKDEWSCYEIKISKSDFNSKNGHNFVGNRNYYIVPKELVDYAKEKTKGTDFGVISDRTIRKHCKLKSIEKDFKPFLLMNLAKALQRDIDKFRHDIKMFKIKAKYNNFPQEE